jgi:hypothetical protein
MGTAPASRPPHGHRPARRPVLGPVPARRDATRDPVLRQDRHARGRGEGRPARGALPGVRRPHGEHVAHDRRAGPDRHGLRLRLLRGPPRGLAHPVRRGRLRRRRAARRARRGARRRVVRPGAARLPRGAPRRGRVPAPGRRPVLLDEDGARRARVPSVRRHGAGLRRVLQLPALGGPRAPGLDRVRRTHRDPFRVPGLHRRRRADQPAAHRGAGTPPHRTGGGAAREPRRPSSVSSCRTAGPSARDW